MTVPYSTSDQYTTYVLHSFKEDASLISKMTSFSMGMVEAHTRKENNNETTAQPMITSSTMQAGADGDVFNHNHYTSLNDKPAS